MPSETTTACVSLLVFFRIRRGTFPYGVEDDASTISQTPTTHYTSTCVKLTIVTHLSFSERIAIANLSYYLIGQMYNIFGLLLGVPDYSREVIFHREKQKITVKGSGRGGLSASPPSVVGNALVVIDDGIESVNVKNRYQGARVSVRTANREPEDGIRWKFVHGRVVVVR